VYICNVVPIMLPEEIAHVTHLPDTPQAVYMTPTALNTQAHKKQ